MRRLCVNLMETTGLSSHSHETDSAGNIPLLKPGIARIEKESSHTTTWLPCLRALPGRARYCLVAGTTCTVVTILLHLSLTMSQGQRPRRPLLASLSRGEGTEGERLSGQQDRPSQQTGEGLWKNSPFQDTMDTNLFFSNGDVDSKADSRHPDKPSTHSSFMSPLIVTGNDWPLKKNFGPIFPQTALGLDPSLLPSSSIPSYNGTAGRPITIALVRRCKSEVPDCFEHFQLQARRKCVHPDIRLISEWESADIVVFNIWRLTEVQFLPRFHRPAGQLWVMLSSEAPVRGYGHQQLDLPFLKGQFNLTMGYRPDSDIPFPYGFLTRRSKSVKKDWDAIYSTKHTHAAWLVSHCDTGSQRELYASRLQAAGLGVHIYGACGNMSCVSGLSESSDENEARSPDGVCNPRISRNYFFYFSFENTFCKNYVTEKFFKVYGDLDVVPVVRGGVNYKALFPPGTFVDAADFASPADLSRFLVALARDKKRYLHMLREKYKWVRVPRPNWLCTLIKALAAGVQPKVIPDARSWFTAGQCWRPKMPGQGRISRLNFGVP